MKRLLCACLLPALLGLAGCERVMRNMYDQPVLRPGDASPLFADGPASRPPPPGSVPRAIGIEAGVSSGARGEEEADARDAADARQALPPVPGRALLLRGQERYTIYCLPCHGAAGDGDGMVVRRGFPAPPGFHEARLVAASDRHLYDVIGQGYGVMYPFADRVEPPDRWAVVAYLRALQASRAARLADLPAETRARLLARLERPATTPTPPMPATGWRETPAAAEAGR